MEQFARNYKNVPFKNFVFIVGGNTTWARPVEVFPPSPPFLTPRKSLFLCEWVCEKLEDWEADTNLWNSFQRQNICEPNYVCS